MTHFRASPRYVLEHRVGVRIGDSLEREAILDNVGIAGAGLTIHDPPPIGTVVRIRISTATSWEPITVDAIVRWLDEEALEDEKTRVGLELAPLSPQTALALDAWLSTLGYDSAPVRRG